MKNKLLNAFLFLTLAAGCGVDKIEDPGDNPGADSGGGGDDGGAVEQDNRVTDGLQLLYKFGGVAAQTAVTDTSGSGAAFDLTVADPAQVTFDAEGLTFLQVEGLLGTVASNPNPITKVIDACKASSTITVEAWVKNAGIVSDGRIVSSGIDAANHNFAIKQTNDYYELRLRTSQNNANGDDPYLAAAPVGTATAVEQHIVVARSTIGVTSFYIDGLKQAPDSVPGNFGNWDLTYGIYIGNEASLDRPWFGTIYLLAVYCKELSQEEIDQNYADGH